MQTILGANGIIATELAKELYKNYTKDIRLVSRNPKKVNETDTIFPADLLDPKQAEEAIKGSEIVYLTVGLPNVSLITQERWPIIMHNVIEACISFQTKLVFFDNTYMYGESEGFIKEGNPFLATGLKGLVRSKVSTMLLHAMNHYEITAMICRAPEFYGPRNTKSITNALVFENILNSKKIKVLVNENKLRTLMFTPDAGRALALLGNTTDAYNQTWHLPCDDNRLTTKELINQASKILRKRLHFIVLRSWMVKLKGNFDPYLKETIEILYRYKSDHLFDSSKFKTRFPDFKVTPYKVGIAEILKDFNTD
ncbi:MAG: NAD-dependent epimerase/dehydratase family protein [Paludibacter sp.]|nr:NAD-dependent epimerase/dehydratase family protein [Paludibacter sp.]